MTYQACKVDLFRYYAADIAQEAPTFAEGLPQPPGVPSLLPNGIDDTTTPVRMSRELADLLVEAELVEVEGVTHMGPMFLNKEAEPNHERHQGMSKKRNGSPI